ncbi:alpha-L-rhamnosidase [Pseudoalteromonas sp. APC 3355]|uniref:alpha-L-rhamnosidase n=1 Tax=Pseudoalteromonas sp. APC 3355 TaxID=3035199 RepID=UPI0025B3F7AB|nr:alpha-L-rhamnosidase [Pseudoalteromonas sp. APC 3355]MDN3476478.1 family 78 glycoside hydrolase catalytic domain [Pseudoalteromonas sp. APC 3355]
MNKSRQYSLFNKTFVKALILTLIMCFNAACTSERETPHSQQAYELIAAPVELKVGEGFESPVGYYESKPRFSWEISQNTHSNFQSAYQIQVSSTLNKFNTQPDLWDSKKVNSSNTSWVQYQGLPLNSRQQLYWRVKVWNEKNQVSQWSKPQSIELGLLSNKDWQAQWIGHPNTQQTQNPSKSTIATPQYFRKSFNINKKIQQARLYITSKGVFKPFINGEEVSKIDVMTPGWTPYNKRIETLTYDLTDKLTQGENTFASILAGGWFSARIADLKDTDHIHSPLLLAQLEVQFTDGSKQVVTTDESWKVTQNGPIRFASNYDGEHYSQAKEQPNWNKQNFDSSAWPSVYTKNLDPAIKLSPKRHEPIRVISELSPIKILNLSKSSVVFDFGQNMVGVPEISVPAVANQKIKIEFAEALHMGEFYTDNYRSALSTNYFTPSKSGRIKYKPTFTFHGYRYIKLSGFDTSKVPSKDWVKALVQHSDIKLYDNFSSSHSKLNKLFSNINWGLKSNFYDVPLDCPQRDERLGWTGDANAFVTPSMYMADSYGFWSAWLESMREEQTDNGKIPLYIPYVEWIKWTSSGWGDAATIIPWELYIMTGDKSVLADNYDMMKNWLKYHESQSNNHISNMQTFGDWLQPYPKAQGKKANRGDTDFSLIGTAFYARSIELTLNTAKVLNRKNDVEQLTELHQQIKTAFRNTFFDQNLIPKKGEPTQTAYLLALEFNLLEQTDIEKAQEQLIELIQKADNHLRTGFLGTPLLASALQKAGRSDLVYELLFKESYPSWFYSINNGATTTWERWNSYSLEDGFNPQGMNSLNHYAYGTISRWFYEGILGVTPIEAGFKEFKVSPQFSQYLNEVGGTIQTINGAIELSWTLKGDQASISLTVPKNSTAILDLAHLSDVTVLQQSKNVTHKTRLTPGEYVINGKI